MGVLLQWRPDWLTTAALAVLVGLVVRARLRLRAAGQPWPVLRDVAFAAGVLLAAWTTSGILQVRGEQVEWVWTAQELLLLLVVPVLLVAGQPVALLRGTHRTPRVLRLVGHPALSPLYVPVVCGLLFFGGVGQLALSSEPVSWALHLALLAVGAVVALPLVDRDDARSSLAVGAALAVGVVELLLDAVPGIVLRLETHLTVPWFDAPGWLAGQQSAGGLLWTVAEVLDLPFLVLTVLQWIRVERREAVRVDAELDRAAPTGEPWWLADPVLRARYGSAGRDDPQRDLRR
ncbi:cytochrome c oxidase assembly protein [Klenkia sp. PcliD-1-E]|uniref:cytochrome c oxidase assembly protein n=1 Tax=Klenkia sp. PcliD-1-E TaxID=2954492 RepID=UPI0020974874|nr:cytochrome c oxidase assembly protein [Klenkia sp. PcliD-1-E]MCO7219622.1 cytochrome c oxidase assembly protein [Klenkia sp. PcliD-1-E]